MSSTRQNPLKPAAVSRSVTIWLIREVLHCLSVVFLFVSDPWSLYQPVKSPEYASFKDKKQNQTGLIQVLLRGFVDSWAFIITSITCLYISLLVTIVI